MSTTGKKLLKIQHMEAKQHASEKTTNHRRNQNMHRTEWKWKHSNSKPVGLSKSSAKGKVHSNTSLPQEIREKSNK